MTTAHPAADAPDGIVTLPRRAPFWAVCALAITMAGQVFWPAPTRRGWKTG